MTPRAALVALACALAFASVAQVVQRRVLRAEIAATSATRTSVSTLAGDVRLIAEIERIRFALEQARGRPAKSAEPHLALALSDGLLTLERGGIVFRTATVQAEVLRGVHVVEQVQDRVVTLSGGIRLLPATAESTALRRGEIRVPRADFLAILPNLRPGQSAYLF